MESNYKRLGNYIERLNRPNTDLKYGIDDVCGITNTKEIMQGTRANLNGRTFEKFTVLLPNEFIFNRRTSRNGERISLGYNNTGKVCILTEDYCHFRIKEDKQNELLSDYLYLYFCNPEFDRYARYNSWGSATEFFNWEDMCDVKLIIPDITEQEKIVRQYKTITDRIDMLEKIDLSLFNQGKNLMQLYYLNENYFSEEIVSIEDFCKSIYSGGTPSRTTDEYWDSKDVPWLKNGEIKNNIILDTEEYISEKGLTGSSAKLVEKDSVSMAMYCVSDIQVSYNNIPLTTNQAVLNMVTDSKIKSCFLFYLLATFGNDITSNANGSAQQNLSKEIIGSYTFNVPYLENSFFNCFQKNIEERILIAKEITELTKIKMIVLNRIF